ncbi:MAG: tRNA-uridine aminocarboxypropyltransferase [Polyangiaceae bacterium]
MDPRTPALAAPTNDGSRTKRAPRCPACWLPLGSCVCAELPRIDVATRVVIVMHHVEGRRASNTGRLAAKILGADVRLRGVRTDPTAPLPTEGHGSRPTEGPAARPMPEGRRIVLFPAESARTLRPEDALSGPLVLVVPDGNWRQASRVIHRDEAAAGAEIVTLPPGPPSRYRLRKRHHDAALSTFEAIARALAILEEPSIEGEMMRAFDLFVARTLALRGGIPAIGFED